MSRDEALTHAAEIAAATELPVSADLESGFSHAPEGVAATVRLAASAGLAGCSIEDFTGDSDDPIYERSRAVERVAAAAEVAKAEATRLVLTARAENHLHGRPDLADTIARLQAFAEAGADVVYAPGLADADAIGEVVRAVDIPANVLLLPGGPNVGQLAALGVARISVGGAFHAVAMAALETAARELLEEGTHGFWARAIEGGKAIRRAFR